MSDCAIFWFRRDLRLEDNGGLLQALKSQWPVVPIFIFDSNILAKLPRDDARVGFILESLLKLHTTLQSHGRGLTILHGSPEKVWPQILKKYSVRAVFCNEDYEPYALERDAEIAALLKKQDITFTAVKDQVIFAKDEVTKDDGKPYRMYTPYARKWRAQFKPEMLKAFASQRHVQKFVPTKKYGLVTLKELGFAPSAQALPPVKIHNAKIKEYALQRNYMGEVGATSRMGLHLRFGTVSVRRLIEQTRDLSDTYVGELIWREFFMQILYHFPYSATEPFDARYAAIEWRNSKADFKKWCEGKTGYPIVDAGMHELNQTGFMHNRARMVAASFLTKHLLIDWRWGERYFAEKLLDYEMSANVGNWQWCAGCGCDAAPYFRVFNPTLQAKKFDKEQKYVKRWIQDPEPEPMVDHEMARRRALTVYRKALHAARKEK